MSSDFAPPAGATAPESPHAPYAIVGEPTPLAGPRAGFGRRLLATIIDSLIVGVPFGIVAGVVPEAAALLQLLALVVGIAYYAVLEGGRTGQTIGKRAMGIRVVDVHGAGPIGAGRAVIRYLGRIVSSLPLFLGYLWMLWDRDKQTWHDKFASSLVVPVSAHPVD
jgi:uncharacterized RDD family membrane protein YckC